MQQIVQTILKSHNLDFAVKKDLVATLLVMEGEENLDDLTIKQVIDRGYEQNTLPKRVLQLLAYKATYFKDCTIENYVNIDGRLYY